jgi:hypothetical protein
MKDQLVFDVTDANTIADSDSVGAYVRSSDGTLITHTTEGSKEALDVNIAASDISIDVDLDHTEDSVRLGDGTNFLTSTSENGDIALDVHISNTSIEVTATDLDIRDLQFATDSVDVSGSTLGANDGVDIGDVTVNNGAGAAAVNIQDGGNSITVDAVDLDIRDLSASQDNVAISDGTDTLAIEADGSINVNVASIEDAALANTAIANGATTSGAANTAVDAVASALADRKYLFLYNNDNRRMFVGATGVTAANGFPVAPRAYLEMRAGASIDIEFVSPKAAHELRYLELS